MVRTATVVIGSATVLIVFLPPSNSDLSRTLNSSRGKSRKPAATRTSGSTLASTFAGLPSARANNTSTARFRCSIFFASLFRGLLFRGSLFRGSFGGPRERLGIGTLHARPQTRQRAELQLLHRAFRLADLPRHFLNAFLFHEPQHNHTLLLGGQCIDQPKQSGPPFHLFKFCVAGRRSFDQPRLVHHLLPAPPLPAVRNQIRGNPEQPRRKRNPPPFKPLQVSQRMMKHFRSEVFGFRAISHPPHHVRVHPLEIILVKLRKARRILLRRLDQKPLVCFFPQSLQTDSPRGVVLHRDNETGREKVTQGFQPGAPFLAYFARSGRAIQSLPTKSTGLCDIQPCASPAICVMIDPNKHLFFENSIGQSKSFVCNILRV